MTLPARHVLQALSDGRWSQTAGIARAAGVRAREARSALQSYERRGVVESHQAPHGGPVYWRRVGVGPEPRETCGICERPGADVCEECWAHGGGDLQFGGEE